MGRRITGIYNSYVSFKIPKNITLLSVDENESADNGTPFSWCIRYSTMIYYDKDGEEQYIYAEYEDHQNKCPESYESDETDTDDEDDDDSDSDGDNDDSDSD